MCPIPTRATTASTTAAARPTAPLDPAKRYPPGDLEDPLHVRLFQARSLSIDPRWNSPDVLSSYWRLYHNDRDGAAVRLADGRDYPLTGQRIHFVPAWVRFTCRCSGELQHLFLHFDLIGLPRGVVEQVFPAPRSLPGVPDLEARAAELAQRLITPSPELPDQLACKGLLYDALAALLRELDEVDRQACRVWTSGENPVAPALAHIEQHLDQPLSNADLAGRCHLSEDHFIRRFRQAVGETPARFVQQRRVLRAAQQLVFSQQSIDQIAEATGFGNRFYFSRVFRRVMGLPPGEYRQREQG